MGVARFSREVRSEIENNWCGGEVGLRRIHFAKPQMKHSSWHVQKNELNFTGVLFPVWSFCIYMTSDFRAQTFSPRSNMNYVPRSGPGAERYFKKKLLRWALPAVTQSESFQWKQARITFVFSGMWIPKFCASLAVLDFGFAHSDHSVWCCGGRESCAESRNIGFDSVCCNSYTNPWKINHLRDLANYIY